MPKIEFRKTHFKSFEVPKGANLMKSLLSQGRPVASSCQGDGVCGKCKIEIVSGMENLSQENEVEVFLREKNQIPKGTRISCQVKIFGDVTVDTGYW